VPTENYFTFQLAKELGTKVGDMLVGGSQPLSAMEHYLWQRWELATARLKQQQQRKGGKRG
jgi:hypothetical protein